MVFVFVFFFVFVFVNVIIIADVILFPMMYDMILTWFWDDLKAPDWKWQSDYIEMDKWTNKLNFLKTLPLR